MLNLDIAEPQLSHRPESLPHALVPADATTAVPPVRERNGVVYTKRWVVELILDLAGYTSDCDLQPLLIVEPAAGDGNFVVAIVERLLASCRKFNRSISSTRDSLVVYELDPDSSSRCRRTVRDLLLHHGVNDLTAGQLVEAWIHSGDYLLDLKRLPKADLVVGNPPYVRLEDIAPDRIAEYRHRYQTMVGRADLYVAFFEAALSQLKSAGTCAFICADRWMLNQYGAQLRSLITSRFSVERVIELHRADAFESEVSAYPAITVIRNHPQRRAIVARGDASIASMSSSEIRTLFDQTVHAQGAPVREAGIKAASVNDWFTDTQPWPCYNPERLTLLKHLEANFYPLDSKGTATRSGIGVASGADKIYLTTNPEAVESDRLLPIALAKDIRSGHLQWSGHYLLNPWNGPGLVPLEKYPRLATYLAEHEAELRQRHVGKRNPERWYRTIDRVEAGLLHKTKLYIPDIKDRLNPVLDRGETYPHHNLYFIQSAAWDHEVLGGLLLSDVAQFFIECYGVRMRGGYLRFQAQYLRRIRVPRPVDVSPCAADGLRQAFQTRDRAQATDIAMKLYGITHIPEDDY
ncbi:MAG: Eco57I restriction-modification methylase domain-containing protein [Thermomicrobiales bacterium]